MEVHAHSHTARKKWTHYFWEFLMLFLAVFCGFLAENKREHIIEHRRAKELAVSLYEEMKSDSAILNKVITNRQDKEEHLLYVANYFHDSSLTNLPREFYPRFTWALFATSYIVFEPKDGMLQQLKNSGSLRYFRSIEIQKAVGDFTVALDNLKTRFERENALTTTLNRDILLRHFDYSWLSQIIGDEETGVTDLVKKYLDGKSFIQASLRNLASLDKMELFNYLTYYKIVLRSTRLGQMKQYRKASEHLLHLLRKEYHLQ